MEYNPKLLEYLGEEKRVVYDGITLQLTRQLVEDWVAQTGEHPKTLIMHYYIKEVSQIRQRKLQSLITDQNLMN